MHSATHRLDAASDIVQPIPVERTVTVHPERPLPILLDLLQEKGWKVRGDKRLARKAPCVKTRTDQTLTIFWPRKMVKEIDLDDIYVGNGLEIGCPQGLAELVLKDPSFVDVRPTRTFWLHARALFSVGFSRQHGRLEVHLNVEPFSIYRYWHFAGVRAES